MKLSVTSFLILIVLWLSCCSEDKLIDDATMKAMEEASKDSIAALGGVAQVTKVEFSGDPNSYTLDVTIASPDTGCDQYADWWEVIDLEGNLIYRRILTHSHVDEQPFTRSGGAVDIAETTEIYIRAHMNNAGYGSTVQKGSVLNGFRVAELAVEFAKNLAETAPLPDGCAF